MKSGYINLPSNNKMYYEISGNMQGEPLIFIHGGPASGINKNPKKYIDLNKYMLIEYDQRGCGKSSPIGITDTNNTKNLINDIELLRTSLKIDKFSIAGSSWGSTLALLYSQKYPQNIESIHIAGVFLANKKSLDWYMSSDGACKIIPDLYKDLLKQIPVSNNIDYKYIAKEYLKIFRQEYSEKQRQALEIYMKYQNRLAFITKLPEDNSEYLKKLNKAIIMTEYLLNDFYLKPNQVLNNMSKIKDIPIFITQGRFDLLCLVDDVFDLINIHKDTVNLDIVEDSGHMMSNEMLKIYYSKINTYNS